MKNNSLSPRSRIQSFGYAIKGILQLIIQEPNARIHMLATVVVITGGVLKHLSPTQWIAIAIAIGLVWITEALNTTAEMLCDLYCKGEYNEKVKVIKDIAAGAVLIASITAITIALFVFLN